MSDFRMREDTMQHVFEGRLTYREGLERFVQFRGLLSKAQARADYMRRFARVAKGLLYSSS